MSRTEKPDSSAPRRTAATQPASNRSAGWCQIFWNATPRPSGPQISLCDHTVAAGLDGDVDGLLHDLGDFADEDRVRIGSNLDAPSVECLADEHELGGRSRRHHSRGRERQARR